MHSRIFEISRTPVMMERRYKQVDVPEEFCYQVADYVDDDVSREDDIRWFKNRMTEFIVDVDDDCFTFKSGYKQRYFEKKYHQFIKTVKELSGINLECFSGCGEAFYPLERKMCELNALYEDKFEFYIRFEDELIPIDNWVRYYDFKEGEKLYFGGTIDYHF